MGGQREALLIGAVALIVGVAFLLLRGSSPAVDPYTDWADEIDFELEPIAS
jgi:hypothetical protein